MVCSSVFPLREVQSFPPLLDLLAWFHICFFNDYLLERGRGWGLPSTGSPLKYLQWLRPKPGATNSIQILLWVIGNQSLEPSLLPLRVHISRKLNQEPEDDIESRLSGVGCRHFNHWARCPPLRVVFGFTFLEGTSSAQLIFVCLPCQV